LKRLNEILQGIDIAEAVNFKDTVVKDMTLDSRKVKPGCLFFAVKGTANDGHKYIGSAVENGAGVIVCETLPDKVEENVVYIKVADIRTVIAKMAGNFFDHPDRKLKLTGVTGTNGKTTIATWLYETTMDMGFKAGLISTVVNKIGPESTKATLTTPDAIELRRLIKKMTDAGCEYVFMEVSSHASDQDRICCLDFDGGIFTNITLDHLDYHKTFKNYINAKKKFFDNLKPEAFALTNIDDKNGKVMVQNCKARICTYGLKKMADFKGKVIDNSIHGLLMEINNKEVFFKLSGIFNAYNLCAVYGAAVCLGFDEDNVLLAMSKLEPVEGRFNVVSNKENDIFAIIDFAHTPDALENILKTATKIKKGKLIVVFGAGGNRDKSKRPEMGKIAVRYADTVIITSDNPRYEEPEDIIEEIYAGIEGEGKDKVVKITDRRQAIKTALMLAQRNDLIVIAGKGHENYQDIKGKKIPFSDKETVMEFWN